MVQVELRWTEDLVQWTAHRDENLRMYVRARRTRIKILENEMKIFGLGAKLIIAPSKQNSAFISTGKVRHA